MLQKQFQQLTNGEKLAYLKAGDGPNTIVLLHGNYSSSYQYLPFLTRLPEGYTAYAVDLRGFGDSTYYRRVQSILDYADDINRFIKSLKLTNITVVGWSLGGGVALELVARHPEYFQKLVLISSTTYRGYPLYKKDEEGNIIFADAYKSADELRSDPEVVPLLEAIKNHDEVTMKRHLDNTHFKFSKPDDEYYKLLVNEALKERCLVDADWAIASLNMSSEHNFYNAGNQDINLIDIPVLHLVGQQDVLTPRYMVLDNYYALRQISTLIEYPDCGHGILIDSADEVSSDIINFIENKLPQGIISMV